jgi:hypothetical protein
MDKRPFIDRSLLIPIGISVFSIAGILVIGLVVYLDKPQVAVSTVPTPTPFKYLLLATETLIPDLAAETIPPGEVLPRESTGPFQVDPSEEEFSTLPAETTPQANLPVSTSLPGVTTVSATGTTVSNIADRYDDADPRLDYDGDWVPGTNVANAYQRTLSVSNTIGNDLILTFVGQQIVIGYLGEPGLGSMAISIDDDEFQLDQSTGKEWTSPQLDNSEHFVIIIHESGDSVNLDYINILGTE